MQRGDARLDILLPKHEDLFELFRGAHQPGLERIYNGMGVLARVLTARLAISLRLEVPNRRVQRRDVLFDDCCELVDLLSGIIEHARALCELSEARELLAGGLDAVPHAGRLAYELGLLAGGRCAA